MTKIGIPELKELLPINKVLGYYILGKDNLTGKQKYCCPFHSEKTASLHANDDIGSFMCFGCKEHGDIISFVEKYKGISFREALEELAETFNIDIDFGNGKVDPLYQKKKDIYEIHKKINNIFLENILKEENKGILDILIKERKLDLKIIEEFELGYSKGYTIEKEINLILKDYPNIKKEDISLYNDQGFFMFSDRIIYPIRNHRGKIVAFSGGRIYPEQEPKYIHSSNNLVYNKADILFNLDKVNFGSGGGEEVIFCEGNLDSLQLYNYGDRKSIALLGTSLSDSQIGLLKGKVKKVILILDKDVAGNKATIEISKKLISNNIIPYIINLPGKEKDVDDFLKHNPELKGKISEYIDKHKMEYFEEYLINNFIKNEEKLTLERRIYIITLIRDMLANIKDEILFNAYNTILKKYNLLFKETEDAFTDRKEDIEKKDNQDISKYSDEINIYTKIAVLFAHKILKKDIELKQISEYKLLKRNFIKYAEFKKMFNFICEDDREKIKSFLEENKQIEILIDDINIQKDIIKFLS